MMEGMKEYVLDYMGSRGVSASSRNEQEALEIGISRYLLESGIGEGPGSEYRKKYVCDHLQKVSTADLKAYFINYPLMSEVRQIVIEFKHVGSVPEDRKRKLYQLMELLYKSGLGDKFVPVMEIRKMLDDYLEK